MTKKSTNYQALSERTRTVLAHFRKETGQAAITQAMGVDRTIISAVINRLFNLKLIECTQKQNPTLRQLQLYKITKLGEKELADGKVAPTRKGQLPVAPSQSTKSAYEVRDVMRRPSYKTGDGLGWFRKSL